METNSQHILYDVLKLYRNAIFTNYDTYYTNQELYKLAQNPPKTKEKFLEILPSQEEFNKYGKKFVELIKLFEPLDQADSILAKSRKTLEDFEVNLHEKIIKLLKVKFNNENWWYLSIPNNVRIKAATLHEESEGTIPKENCLYLNDLKEIIIKHWETFKDDLDPENNGKKEFESSFRKLNDIRNRLGHPMRLKDDPITQEDLDMLTLWLTRINNQI